jgi:CRP/FNR family transcriptional regulator, anaerobic regulatory protein
MQVATTARSQTSFRPQPAAPVRPALRDVNAPTCSSCSLRKFCVSPKVDDMAGELDRLVGARVRLHKGDVLFRAGDRFTALYAVRMGSCKTVMLTDDGSEQVVGNHLPGDIIGIEAIAAESHGCQAVALEDSEVCTLPFDRIEALAHADAGFQHNLHRMMSREIGRERGAALMLGTMRAEQRLSWFLLDLSIRYQARGYSSTEFVLRMTREEIGSQLGLKLETVSRLFSRFHDEALIQVRGRVVTLIDRLALQQLITAS